MKTWIGAAAVLLLSTAGCRNEETTSSPPAAAQPAATEASAITPDPAPRRRPAPPEAAANTPCEAVGKLFLARKNVRIVALPDERVLFVGGGLSEDSDPRVEVDAYDPKTSTVTPFAPLSIGRLGPGVAALADGRVVVVGGHGAFDQALDTIEIYDPSTKAFRVLKARLERPVASPFAIQMKDGRVLFGGGSSPPRSKGAVEWETPRSSFILDPATGKVERTGDTPWPLDDRGFPTVAANGVITVTGQGQENEFGVVMRDCATAFDPASKTWTDAKRCQELADPFLFTNVFHAANGAQGTAAISQDGLQVYRNGRWGQLAENVFFDTTGLTGGLSLDEHRVIAVDGATHQVVYCSY